MIKVLNLSMRNFLSVGNVAQSINLNRNELVLVLGENMDLGGEAAGSRNGVGKTAMINAISYALYGASISNIKKEHLVNKSNGKNMTVTLEFESNGNQYRIDRGRKPNILHWFENGVNKSESTDEDDFDSAQGDSRNTQQEIEKVIGMSHDMFCQVVAINTYTTPFLFQKVADQRIVIEQLLGITLLSEKALKLKDEIKDSRTQLMQEEMRIAGVETANKRIQTQIDSLVLKQEAWGLKRAADLTSLNQKIAQLEKIDIERELLVHAQWQSYDTLNRDISAAARTHSQSTDLYNREERNLLSLKQNLTSLKTKCCHTCKQTLSSDVHHVLLVDTEGKIAQSETELTRLSGLIQLAEDTLLGFPENPEPPGKAYASLTEAHNHKNKLLLLKQQYDQRGNEVDPYQEQIEGMQKVALEPIDLSDMNVLTKFIEHQEFLLKLLTSKDSFIRKKIIEQNLSYLNGRLSHYLAALNLPHQVIFQNDLSVDISELGRELSPGNLSRGEMSRVSLGLSFSFRDVWENLYQRINLLFVDESMDNGLDSNGAHSAVNLLRDMNREQGRDVWLISHKEEILSKVNSVCRVVKENGFTVFSFDE